jgi:hypothetical protein
MSYSKEHVLSEYKNKLSEMLSNDDFNKFYSDNIQDKIMKYSELKNYNDIPDVIPIDRDFRLILIETTRNAGHWTLLIRKDNIYYYFDSYGKKVDKEFKYIPNQIRRMLGQTNNDLTRLLVGDNVLQNTYKFQSNKDGINTCGKWCVMVQKLILKGFNFDDIADIVDIECEKNNKPPDIIVCDWAIKHTKNKSV